MSLEAESLGESHDETKTWDRPCSLTDIAKYHDKDATQSENYLACDGHVKYVKIPYISFYGGVATNNMGAYLLTFNYN